MSNEMIKRSAVLFVVAAALPLCGQELPTRVVAGTQFVRFPQGQVSCDITDALALGGDLSGRTRTIDCSAFWLAATEVTTGQFREFVTATKYVSAAERYEAIKTGVSFVEGLPPVELTWRRPGFESSNEHPVTCVTYDDAVAYCAWLTEKHSVTFRLPTTAEWQYAATFGGTGSYDFPDLSQAARFVNVADAALAAVAPKFMKRSLDDGVPHTAPVTAKSPGRNGLRLMHGNVAEWCRNIEALNDPAVLNGASVLRGGSWLSSLEECASINRQLSSKKISSNCAGFRVAYDVNTAAELDAPLNTTNGASIPVRTH
jgi:formylglycine-generating enzyme required for sulfatase activity